MTAREKAQLVVDVERAARRVSAVQVWLLGEADASLVAEHEGATSTVAWLKAVADVPIGLARARLRLHRGLASLAVTAEAFAAGDIGQESAGAIVGAIAALPSVVPFSLNGRIEQILVEVAREDGTAAVVQEAAKIGYRFAPDALEQAERAQSEQNKFTLVQRHDGTVAVRGLFDKEAGALALAVLGPLARPLAAVGGVPDQRTAPTRYADAFIQAIRLAGAASPDVRGDRPTVLVTISFDALRGVLGELPGVLDNAAVISAGAARRLACDALIIPVVLGANSEPLDIGRATRVIPAGMRRALVARDQGCTMPGCERPAAWCDAHHGIHWTDGGCTALINLLLLCERHHSIVHDDGWVIEMRDGRPWFIPPRWIDPDQTPRLHNRFKTHQLDP